jgi:hypothetical protein
VEATEQSKTGASMGGYTPRADGPARAEEAKEATGAWARAAAEAWLKLPQPP